MKILLAVVSLGLASTGWAQAPCTKASAATSLYLEPAARGASDTVMTVRLCLSSSKKLGSYMALLRFDPALMRPTHVVTRGGVHATNLKTPGEVRIAGAAPSGFANGEVASMTFKPGQQATGHITLSVSEANTISGTSLLNDLAVVGWQQRGGAILAPVIDSISPRAAELDGDRVTDLTIYGRGFAARENLVLFGRAEIPGLMSEANGTVIRFSAPTVRAREGKVPIRVKHDGLQSNAVTFTLKEGER
jgi:hypothetical protein